MSRHINENVCPAYKTAHEMKYINFYEYPNFGCFAFLWSAHTVLDSHWGIFRGFLHSSSHSLFELCLAWTFNSNTKHWWKCKTFRIVFVVLFRHESCILIFRANIRRIYKDSQFTKSRFLPYIAMNECHCRIESTRWKPLSEFHKSFQDFPNHGADLAPLAVLWS